MRTLLPLLLLACADPTLDPELPPLDALPGDEAAPPLPQTMALSITDPIVIGQTVNISITGASPNTTLYLARSNGTYGNGQCPPQLNGYCLSITPGGSGYGLVPMRTNGQGSASLAFPIPTNVPPGLLVFQAVDPVHFSGSNVLLRQIVSSGCPTDPYEDNDNQATARAGVPNNLIADVCPGDDDYYSYTLAGNESFTATATFDHISDGDIDLYLLDAAGAQLDAATSITSDVEEVQYVNTSANSMTVTLRAHVFDRPLQGPADFGPPGVPYTLDVVRASGACPRDRFEPNDTSATAAIIGANTAYAGLGACPVDTWDWYKIALTGGQTITITAAAPYAEGDVDIFLLDHAEQNSLARIVQTDLVSARTSYDTETVTYQANATGNYWFLIHLYADRGTLMTGVSYSLDVDVQ